MVLSWESGAGPMGEGVMQSWAVCQPQVNDYSKLRGLVNVSHCEVN